MFRRGVEVGKLVISLLLAGSPSESDNALCTINGPLTSPKKYFL